MPLKRHSALQPLSREHHHGLLLCWKIKTGISKGISVDRIKVYADWFYKNHLKPHFDIEEKIVFPVLDANNDLVKQAIAEHTILSNLFHDTTNVTESLKQIEIKLEQHIRFEERVLFNAIQDAATPLQLDSLHQNNTDDKFIDNDTDKFWE